LTLACGAALLIQVGAACWIERSLARAADAACREAVLPRATLASAEEAARRDLGLRSTLARRARLTAEIHRNSGAAGGDLDLRSGDAVTIRLSARVADVAPAWLVTCGGPFEGGFLVGSATRRRP
jgi:hypothetical protein